MAPTEWFCALLDIAPDVYFRYQIEPERRVSYISPSIEALTGRTPAEFYANADLCLGVVASADRRLLRRVFGSRRGAVLLLHLMRDGVSLPVELRTVAVVRRRRVVAIEGVVRLAVGTPRASGSHAAGESGEPVQQRLAALLVEVHDLLHVITRGARRSPGQAVPESTMLRLGALVLDCDRLVVTESGRSVTLTPLEIKVLQYLLERPGRVVTRAQLLQDVWDYRYTGDDRTVDVHVSRLRRKLPSLRDRLTALRGIGYRLDVDEPQSSAASSQ